MRKRWLALLVVLLPLVDALLLVAVVVPYLGAVATVALVVLTGLVGMLLVRAEGRRTLRKTQRTLAKGQPPTNELLDGGLLIAAGAFLLAPGIVTDVLGFVFAVPLTRIPIRIALKKWVVVPYVDEKTGGFGSGNVYVGGFPGDSGGFPGDSEGGVEAGGVWGTGEEPEAGPFGPGGTGDDDVHDLSEDAYDIDVDDVQDEGS